MSGNVKQPQRPIFCSHTQLQQGRACLGALKDTFKPALSRTVQVSLQAHHRYMDIANLKAIRRHANRSDWSFMLCFQEEV